MPSQIYGLFACRPYYEGGDEIILASTNKFLLEAVLEEKQQRLKEEVEYNDKLMQQIHEWSSKNRVVHKNGNSKKQLDSDFAEHSQKFNEFKKNLKFRNEFSLIDNFELRELPTA